MLEPVTRLEIAVPTDPGSLATTLTGLVNTVYESSEAGMWLPGSTRTTVAEMTEMITSGTIAVARLAGEVVGCVRIQTLPGGEGEFGLLAADPRHRGVGIGRELVRFAETRCRQAGARVMQLELLVPRHWKHPSKEFLATWYTRIGYRLVRTGSLEESYPSLAPLLATPCDFTIYHKELS